jgi:dipeptidyl aminopeptidase/acylaminoacyl peptidase
VQGNVQVEGLDIPYLLSLPTGKAIKSKTHPLLVMPHGGPIGVFDSAFFDPSIQFLNANGYAVLQVNFRGSSGHSQALKEAGKKQWGKLILNDIHQVTKEVVQRDDISSRKVCLFGMSYGGYASTMLLIQYPDVYRCAVNVSGVSDINLYLNSPYLTGRQIAWTREYIGDPLHSYDELKTQSPVYNVGKLIRPLLIMHGEKDKIVQVEQAHRLRKALDVYERPYEWKLFPDMGHSFNEKKQAIELFSKALEFIGKNIAEPVAP